MTTNFYHRYLAKHKPFRHYTQHFLAGAIGFFISEMLFRFPINPTTVALFLLFSYIVDIDGITSLWLTARQTPEAKLIKRTIWNREFEKAAALITMHHKKFDRLILHNAVVGIVLILFLGFCVYKNFTYGTVAASAVLSHFIFDLSDDMYQLGHIRNWLWPIRVLR